MQFWEFQGKGFEVGWSFTSTKPSAREEVKALEEMLDFHGNDPELWEHFPEIRTMSSEVYSLDFGRGPLVVRPFRWAVYGVLKNKPVIGYIPEGMRMPEYGQRDYDLIHNWASYQVWSQIISDFNAGKYPYISDPVKQGTIIDGKYELHDVS